jgi:hypothetical protein
MQASIRPLLVGAVEKLGLYALVKENPLSGGARRLSFSVEGMHCAACARTLERALAKWRESAPHR